MRMLLLAAMAPVALIATPAMADQPGSDWMPQSRVTEILHDRGYTVTKVEADDGHWEGEATKAGKRYEFHVDPHSGAVTKLERDRD